MSAAVQPLLRCWTCSVQTNHRKIVSLLVMLMTRLLVHILFGLDNNNRNHCAKFRVDCTNNHLAWICVIEDLTLLLPTLVAWLSAYTRGSNYWILEFWGNFFYEYTSISILPRYICFMSGSCHLDRALNDEFSVECLFWFFQAARKSDLKVVQITKNDLFWVNAPL